MGAKTAHPSSRSDGSNLRDGRLPIPMIEVRSVVMPSINMEGQIFDHWTVVSFARYEKEKSFWNCRCSCGTMRVVARPALRYGTSRSCGCQCRLSGKASKNWSGQGDLSGKHWGSILRLAAKRNIPVSITIEEAWGQFEKQSGRCALTGTALTFGTGNKVTASLDRIDSLKGYEIGNIQWVHKNINRMKWHFPQDEFLHWCQLAVEHQTTRSAA